MCERRDEERESKRKCEQCFPASEAGWGTSPHGHLHGLLVQYRTDVQTVQYPLIVLNGSIWEWDRRFPQRRQEFQKWFLTLPFCRMAVFQSSPLSSLSSIGRHRRAPASNDIEADAAFWGCCFRQSTALPKLFIHCHLLADGRPSYDRVQKRRNRQRILLVAMYVETEL